VAGFNGLRVVSFESRRAKEIAQLITSNGGVAMVGPATREVPAEPNEREAEFIRGILDRAYDAVILMTGVGARALIEAAEKITAPDDFFEALRETRVVVRGPKPAAVMREINVPVALSVPEPNTWREIVQAIDANPQALPTRDRRIAVQEHGQPSPQLYEELEKRGAEVFPVRVYRWELPEDLGPLKSAIQSVAEGKADVVMFTSRVQFMHSSEIAAEMGISEQFMAGLRKAVVASIGPIASEMLRSHGVQVDFEPSHPKMGFLVKELADRSEELRRSRRVH
jgi:uroporphyrinogen-III synthase